MTRQSRARLLARLDTIRSRNRASLPRRNRAGRAPAVGAARRTPRPVRGGVRRAVSAAFPHTRSSRARCRTPSGAPAIADRMSSLLRRFIDPNTVFLEIGAGDCSLHAGGRAPRAQVLRARRVARNPERRATIPSVETVLSDGCSVPVPARFRDAGVQLPGHGAHPSRRRARTIAQSVRRDRARTAPTFA